MKHILPILTAALLGAATTASANFYYDYYQNPGYSDPARVNVGEGNYPPYYYTDSYSYGDAEGDLNSGDFKVARNSNWYTTLDKSSTSNFYRIHVLGDNVDLYLTDFVDNVGSPTNANALYNRIDEYGYRNLQLVDGKYVAVGDTNAFKVTVSEEDGTPRITSLDGSYDAAAPTIDSIKVEKSYLDENNNTVDASYTVDRYKYHLGTFKSGDVIELYMKDTEGGVAYSYSNFNEVDENGSPIGAQGGFGDGGYLVTEETDSMLDGYYYQDENLEKAGYNAFENEIERAAASAKSMPLSALDPTANNRVYFGIIASTAGISGNGNGNGNGNGGTFGSPLPGGLQIALIAGLFGLGFWYVRRRKANNA